MEVKYPAKLQPLLAPARYKGAHGGRGGGKSHFWAIMVVLTAFARSVRIVCIREIQKTIRDSVRQLLLDKIKLFGLEEHFKVTDNEIRCLRTDSLIIFRGMQSYNADSIKSLEGYDIVWVEEAQTLSTRSLELLRPTIRKEASELWFSWNPRYKTDPVDKFFRGPEKHPDAIVVQINWYDNEWFPDVLRQEMEFDYENDPETADHVWGGAYGTVKGSILGKWVLAAHREGRIHAGVEYDPDGPGVEISSDIGFRDTATWWFWQRRNNGFALLDYLQGNGMEASDWIETLKQHMNDRQYLLGKIWLPHDAKVRTFQSKHSVISQFVSGIKVNDIQVEGFGANRVGIVPLTKIKDRINAGRTIIKQCEFHVERCAQGIDGLEAWEFEWDDELQVFKKEPLHNWASHPSDGFTYGCQVMQEQKPPDPPEEKPGWWHTQTAEEVFWPAEGTAPVDGDWL